MPNISEVSELALEVGQIILRSGGSTNSCEKLMTRVCVAYGFGETESYVTPTGIFISVGDVGQPVTTQLRRINTRSIDLGKISSVTSLVHTLDQKACVNNPKNCLPLEDFKQKLQAIENEKPYPEWLRIFCGGATSGFFCLLFGGSWLEFAVAYLVGILVSLTLRLIGLLRMNNFMVHALGAAMVVVFAKVLDIWVPYIKLDNIIIGGIMLLVPGLSITNAIRDTMSGDLVSGTARAAEAMVISAAIATGSGTMLKLWSLWGY